MCVQYLWQAHPEKQQGIHFWFWITLGPMDFSWGGNTLLLGTAQGIVSINVLGKSIALEIEHQGGIDGIKPVGGGRYIVSDWKEKTCCCPYGYIGSEN